MQYKNRALFSTNLTHHIIDQIITLIENNWEIIATEKLYQYIKKKRLNAIDVKDFIKVRKNFNFPPTLHPLIESRLTEEKVINKIHLVFDTTYGPKKGIDVGGNTLISLAIKGNRIAITNIKDLKLFINKYLKNEFDTKAFNNFQKKASIHISNYYLKVRDLFFDKKIINFSFKKKYKLANGENPYQTADLYETIYQGDKLSITNFNVLSNNKLCYVNCSDLDCLINILSKINQAYVLNKLQIPFISIAAKHGNVCGIGIDYHSKKISLTKALWGNPQAIWGGELIINFKINLDIANDICASEERLKKFKSEKWMLDLVVSPEITEDSLEKIKLRKNTKILVNKHLYKSYLPKKSQKIYKFLRNAIIEQTSPNFIIKFNELEVISKKRILPRKNLDNLIISWAASYSSFHGGNEVALAKNNMLLNCAGGPSTIEAAETAINRAKKIHKKIGNSVFCADAFLPFIDVLQILKSNNIFIGVMPSGGIRLKEIKKYMKKENMNIGLIQEKFRGFYRH